MRKKEDEDWVERLHTLVDEAAHPVATANAKRLQCKAGCADCCCDDLTVFAIEAAVITRHYKELLESEAPHARGACAFLTRDDKKQCRIYAHRPYVCRTQGLPLRWLEEVESDGDDDGDIVESRDICPLNLEGGPAIEELPADECWTLGPFEQRLADRQGESQERVPLRSLWKNDAAPDSKKRLPILPDD